MSLKELIKKEKISSMKSKDSKKNSALTLILSEIQRIEVDSRKDMSEDEILSLLSKMVKKRKDAIEIFNKANRSDLSEKEQYEIDIVSEFLPKTLTVSETEKVISDLIASMDSPNMGSVMKELKSKYAGQLDFSIAGKIVKEKL